MNAGVTSIVAVVVTYNRCAHLVRCLEALASQSRPLDGVLVIDNASTDGTEQATAESLVMRRPGWRYVRLDQNTGGAGGFARGISLALEQKADWLWLMDDDVAPAETCLEELLKFTDASECLHPVRYSPDGQPYEWEQHMDVLTGTRVYLGNQSFANGKSIVYTNVGCFEGMLVSRRVAEQVGPPDPIYFITEDDTLFGLKASVHTNVAYVKDAHLYRQLPAGELAPWKGYYIMRNSYMLHRDACVYLNLQPTRTQSLLFTMARLIDLSRLLRMGRPYAIPALKGMRDGRAYLRG